MLTHKEFYVWLDGYLTGKLENKHIDIVPIVEKMGEVRDELEMDRSSIRGNKHISPFNPVTMPFGDKDDLGHPPKIVM